MPVGIEYGDYFHLWNSVRVTIGEPINVTARVESRELKVESYPQQILALREELTERMKGLVDERVSGLVDERLPRWVAIPLAILLSPAFVVSALMTIPLWGGWLWIQHKVKDRAFHNSVMYVWQLVFLTITLLIPLPFWMFFQEYIYQLRIKN